MFHGWHSCGGHGFVSTEFGPGFDPGFGGRGGRGFGFGGHRHKRAAFAAAALLLDGPATSAQIVERVSASTGGAFSPPDEIGEAAIGLLAGRGVVTIEDGVATLTEFGRNLLAWRGITSETAHGFLARAGQFSDVLKIRKGLLELGGLARTIARSGTDEQKEKLTEVKSKVLDAITEGNKLLYGALAQA